LAPHAQALGATEGARILGQLYAHQGKFEQAYPLLSRYADERLKDYHAAEQKYNEVRKNVEDDILGQLKTGKAADFPYDRYRAAPKDVQTEIVIEYLDAHVRDDPAFLQALNGLRKESRVVPVALDLGLVLLRRAQALEDPKARRAE